MDQRLNEYAKLLVSTGVAIREGQKLLINCPIEHYAFARMVCEEAYKAGASEVIIKYNDEKVSRLTYEYAPIEVFENFPSWKADELNTYAKEDVAFLHLIGRDPEALKGIDIAKVKAGQRAAYEPLKPYRKLQTSMSFKWCIAALATDSWASKVYPELSVDEAKNKLWENIFATMRISGDNTSEEKWNKHADDLEARCKTLNSWKLKELHYTNSLGTDFTVGLVDGHIWEGGADKDKVTGRRCYANMPTEEVFTMPHSHKAEGKLVAALPLSYQGNLIKDFYFIFKDGEVVDYDAKEGKESLKGLLESDEGSRRLGECALVPYPSIIAQQGILFLETLFDENASCHFALGNCYESNIENGSNLSEEEMKEKGANTAINHVDFMVGTPDLRIEGVKENGEKVLVFENGAWAF